MSIKNHSQAKNHSVLVTLATDGLPSDENGHVGADQAEAFIDALKTLEPMPVTLIIRLSRNEETAKHVSEAHVDIKW